MLVRAQVSGAAAAAAAVAQQVVLGVTCWLQRRQLHSVNGWIWNSQVVAFVLGRARSVRDALTAEGAWPGRCAREVHGSSGRRLPPSLRTQVFDRRWCKRMRAVLVIQHVSVYDGRRCVCFSVWVRQGRLGRPQARHAAAGTLLLPLLWASRPPGCCALGVKAVAHGPARQFGAWHVLQYCLLDATVTWHACFMIVTTWKSCLPAR